MNEDQGAPAASTVKPTLERTKRLTLDEISRIETITIIALSKLLDVDKFETFGDNICALADAARASLADALEAERLIPTPPRLTLEERIAGGF